MYTLVVVLLLVVWAYVCAGVRVAAQHLTPFDAPPWIVNVFNELHPFVVPAVLVLGFLGALADGHTLVTTVVLLAVVVGWTLIGRLRDDRWKRRRQAWWGRTTA